MAKKNYFTPKIRKCMSLSLTATVARDNVPLEYASELYDPSKDS